MEVQESQLNWCYSCECQERVVHEFCGLSYCTSCFERLTQIPLQDAESECRLAFCNLEKMFVRPYLISEFVGRQQTLRYIYMADMEPSHPSGATSTTTES